MTVPFSLLPAVVPTVLADTDLLAVSQLVPTAPVTRKLTIAQARTQFGYPAINVMAAPYNAVGDGVTSDRTAVNALATALTATGGDLIIPPTANGYLIDSALTIPTNVRLVFLPGAFLKVATGVTVNINGPMSAPLSRVFQLVGTGLVQFGSAANQWPFTYLGEVYPEWWGINGNAGAFDTAAVQAAINTNIPVRFNRSYYVTMVGVYGSDQTIDFNGFKLYGVAAALSNTDAVFQIQSYRATLKDVHVDCQFTPTTTYNSAVHWFGDASHTNPGFNEIYGMLIEDCIQGLVIGGFPSNTTPYNAPLSESVIHGLQFHACERALYLNQPNGKIHLVAPQLNIQKNEWTGDGVTTGIFRYSTSYALRNEPSSNAGLMGGSEVVVIGGSIENNDSAAANTGYGIRGANIQADNVIWEVLGTNLIEGPNCNFTGSKNSFGGGASGGKAAFTIAAVAAGGNKMVIRNVNSNRGSGQAAVDSTPFIDATLCPDFFVQIEDSDLVEWGWAFTASGASYLVKGCRALIKNTRYITLSPAATQLIDMHLTLNRLTPVVDTSSTSITTALDKTTPRGGFVYAGGAGANYSGGSTDAPSGLLASYEVGSVAAQTSIADAPSIPCTPGETVTCEGWAKVVTTGGNLILRATWYKFDGTASATPTSDWISTSSPSTLSWAAWSRFVARVKAPVDATKVAVRIYTDGGTAVRFTDLRLH